MKSHRIEEKGRKTGGHCLTLIKEIKVKPADRGKWKRKQRDNRVGDKRKEDLRPLIYIRFNTNHRIEEKKGEEI